MASVTSFASGFTPGSKRASTLPSRPTRNFPKFHFTGPGVGEALFVHLGLSGQLSHLRYFAGVRNLLDVHSPLPTPVEAGLGTVPQYGRTLWFELAANF